MRTMESILPSTKIEKKIAKIADFFHHLCDASTDVIFFMSIDAILGCDIFEKKTTFDSMRLPSLVYCIKKTPHLLLSLRHCWAKTDKSRADDRKHNGG